MSWVRSGCLPPAGLPGSGPVRFRVCAVPGLRGSGPVRFRVCLVPGLSGSGSVRFRAGPGRCGGNSRVCFQPPATSTKSHNRVAGRVTPGKSVSGGGGIGQTAAGRRAGPRDGRGGESTSLDPAGDRPGPSSPAASRHRSRRERARRKSVPSAPQLLKATATAAA